MSKKTRMPYYKEPMLVFLVLGGLLFAVDAYLNGKQKEQIIVDQRTIEYLVERREAIELRDLTPDEIDLLIASYIEEEILYREAYRRGLNEGDTRMRRNLVLKLRGLIVAELSEPTEDELRKYYEDNLGNYTSEEQFSVDHIYYSDASRVPADITTLIAEVDDFRSLAEKYNRTLGRSSVQSSSSELADYFGVEAAKTVVTATSGTWLGPFTSDFGVHFVRKTATVAPETASFEEVAPYLLMDWQSGEARKRIEAEIAEVRENYDIVVTR